MNLARLPHYLWLVAVWVALWDLSVANLVGGALVAGAVLAAFRRVAGPRPASAVRPLPALRYAGVFLVMLVRSTLDVAVQILQPTVRVQPGVVRVRLTRVPDAVATLVANSITLTPGTLTLEATREGEDCVLSVHMLHMDDPDAARADIRRLEGLAVAAFCDRRTERTTA